MNLAALADAVTAELNDAEFSIAFTAARKYLDVATLPETATLRVRVFPATVETIIASRQSTTDTFAIAITVLKRVESDEDCDALAALVKEIADFMRFRRLSALPEVVWVGVEIAPVFDPKRLNENKQFVSQVAVRYRYRRSINDG